jgi:hypothetical protein
VSGEEEQAKGQDGAQRAKRWLEATTRANVPWVNPESIAVRKLTFAWLNGLAFSFDLGGTLLGGDVDGQEFFAESKKYKAAQDQIPEYDAYLAKCYVAYSVQPTRCDNFMWITWAAFGTTIWDKLLSSERVQKAVSENAERALGVPKTDAGTKLDITRCDEVSSRLWIIVLSDRQEEHLVLSAEHQGLIRRHITERRATAT